MGYSYRFGLPGGTLKVKSESRLRNREREREVPVWRLGPLYLVWQPNSQRNTASTSVDTDRQS